MTRTTLLAALIALSTIAGGAITGPPRVSAQEATPSRDCPSTTPEENTGLVQRYNEAAWGQGDTDELDEIVADDVIYHWIDPHTDFGAGRAAFPDRTTTIDLMVAEGDLVALRWSAVGTQTEQFRGISPTGNTAEWSGNSIVRVACGEIAEIWVQLDMVGLLQQLGVTLGPVPLAAVATPARPEESPATPLETASPAACPTTTVEENKALVRNWYDEIWTQLDYDQIHEFITPDHLKDESVGPGLMNAGQYEATVRRWGLGFPDLAFTVVDEMGRDDLVVARWTASGTHQGEFQGFAPTGNVVEWDGITFFRVACGKLAQSWTEANVVAFYPQIGAADPFDAPGA